MPKVRTCRRCGRIYNDHGSAVCNSCRKQETQEAKRIREYLASKPEATPVEVAAALRINLDRVQEYLKQR
jgi:ribosomal protein L37E